MTYHRLSAAAAAIALTAAALQPVQASVGAGAATAAPTSGADVLLDWQRIAVETIYGTGAVPTTPVPTGVPLLGYTSVAVNDAVRRADRRDDTSVVAAAATAAHDVLTRFFPAAGLDDELVASLAAVPDGAAEERGTRTGQRAADRLLRRVADPRLNPKGVVYDRAAAPGVWQPAPGTAFLAPWLGFLDPLVSRRPLPSDGPDPITSREYAFDLQEVRRLGAATGADRTPHQTGTALFFNSNSAIMTGQALAAHLTAHPVGVRRTARIFAVMHGAMTDAIITCWRLKYDHAFWRPSQAIRGAAADGNPATVPDPGWSPLLANPPYPDHVSGHGCLTAPAIETVRLMLGEDTALTLHSFSTNADRTYATLSEIEFDAFHARIWGGLHFRDAMEDAYLIGHTAAQRALRALD